MKEEPVDILDENMGKTGQTMLKSEAHAQSLWHGGAHIWIYNSKGEVLMQLRSPKKLIRPNIWDVSVAGHIAAGKTPLQTVVDEAEEELGIKVNPDNLVFLGNTSIDDTMDGWRHRVFLWIYALKMELNPNNLILEEAETAEAKWVPLNEVAVELKDPKFKHKYAPTQQSYQVAIDKIPELVKGTNNE